MSSYSFIGITGVVALTAGVNEFTCMFVAACNVVKSYIIDYMYCNTYIIQYILTSIDVSHYHFTTFASGHLSGRAKIHI